MAVQTVTAFDSGPFQALTDHANRVLPCAAEILGETLVLAGPDLRPEHNDMPPIYYSSVSLSNLEADIADGKWQVQQFMPQDWASTAMPGDQNFPSAFSQASGAVLGAQLAFVWAQCDTTDFSKVGWRLMLSTYDLTQWGPAYQLQLPDANTAINSEFFTPGNYFSSPGVSASGDQWPWYSPDVCARAYDDKTLIVALTWPDQGLDSSGQPAGSETIYFFLFNLDARQPATGTIAATAGASIPISSIMPTPSGGRHRFTSFDWTDIGGQTYIVLSTVSETESTANNGHPVAVAVYAASLYKDPSRVLLDEPDQLQLSPVTGHVISDGTTQWAGCVRRDFMGRVNVWYRDPSWKPAYYQVSNTEPITTATDSSIWLKPAESFPELQNSTDVTVQGFSIVDYMAASGDPFDANLTPQQTTTDTTATVHPVYRFILFSANPIDASVSKIGWVQAIKNVKLGQPKPKQGTLNILRGIIDGPFPVSNQNISNLAQSAVFEQNPLGNVFYGTSSSTEVSYENSSTQMRGYSTSLDAHSFLGIYENTSQSWGSSNTTGSVKTTIEENNCVYRIEVGDDPNVNPPAFFIVPWGGLTYTQATLYAHVFALVKWGHSGWEADPSYPPFMVSWVDYADGGAGVYVPYMAAPGDLETYTVDQVNTQMATIYAFGRDKYKLPEIPPGSTYLDAIVKPNAQPFGDDPYFTIAWSPAISSNGGYTFLNTNYTEHSWLHDKSLYIGFSSGASLTVDDIEVGSYDFQVGYTDAFSALGDNRTTNTDQWKVGVDNLALLAQSLGTPEDPTPAVSQYTVRLYFLPANPLWTQELMAGIDWTQQNKNNPQALSSKFFNSPYKLPALAALDEIDPNSGPWKIMFVVENGSIRYTPTSTAGS